MSEFDQAMAIDAVHQAANVSEEAAQRLRAEVVRAHRLGVGVTDLATAARVTRQTIYRWVAVDGSPERPRPSEAIREALRIMLPLLEPHQADQISRRMHSRDMNQLLLALKMARAWLPLDAARDFTEVERVALGLATEAENRIRAAQARDESLDDDDAP
ncbi:MAG: hypothetical protein QM628_00175 [Propionicimonas sp.]